MNWELFKKVNKRRGVELINVLEKMEELANDGIDCSRVNFCFVRRIFLHIDKKLPGIWYYDKEMAKEELCRYIHLDYSDLEEAHSDISKIFLDIVCYFHNEEVGIYPLVYDSEDEDDCERVEDIRTNIILKLRPVVKCHISNIINKLKQKFDSLDSIKREKIREDVDYAIYALKEAKTELLEIGKDMARLYVRD